MTWLRRLRADGDPWGEGCMKEGPWLLLGGTAVAAPFAVLGQGGDAHTALLAGLACLASPCFAIEAMQGLARLTQAVALDRD